MDKNKRRSILNADHCWEVPSAAGRWGLSGWVDRQSETQPKGASGFGIQSEHMNSVLTPICTKGLTNWALMLNCGPWKLWRLISQLAIPKSLGFMPLALPNTEKTVARLSFHPLGTSLFTTFPTFPNDCPVITALIWAPPKADAEAKIWAQVIDLGGVKNPSRKVIQGRKAVKEGPINTTAITAGKQSSVLGGALEKSVRHIPQNASIKGERAGALMYQIQGAWVEGCFLSVLIPSNSGTSCMWAEGLSTVLEKRLRDRSTETGSVRLAEKNWQIWGMCLGCWQCLLSSHTWLKASDPLRVRVIEPHLKGMG